MVAAYTAQLGNGLSMTISAEQTRRGATVYAGDGAFTTTFVLGNLPAANDLAGIPTVQGGAGSAQGVGTMDFVGNIRIDQAWGSAQISGALHDLSAGYYYNGVQPSLINEQNGHPGNKWGWAASAGIRLNAPMIAPGDYFQAAAHYCEGAIKYCAGATPTSAGLLGFKGTSLGFGFWTDGVFGGDLTAGTATDVQLTTAWSVMASYEHFWTPNFRTSIYGSYVDVRHNATARDLICNTDNGGGTSTGFPWAAQSDGACDPNFGSWNVGMRAQWDIIKGLYVGLDVIYLNLKTARLNAANTVDLTEQAAGGGKGSALYRIEDQDAWVATWRIHRDILP
jgi:hypothetical protein